MKLTPIELNIRASWAINCAVAFHASYPEAERTLEAKYLFSTAKEFLQLLDEVKAFIEAPELPAQGKSTPEKKEIAKDEAENDAGNNSN
jgi:hypothetical protein